MRGLTERIDAEQGRLDILVSGLWGGDHLARHGLGLEHDDWDEAAEDFPHGDAMSLCASASSSLAR
ncbi:hypothetical protein [Lipingzhangella rawalii]|uniref:hypothetical protein n=1 Tax=Lipingzhangella rawalii TaxID=2055835 RepID=UPI00287BB42C|nr:hypothetical protein [Lipingzhangella rawalii]